MQMRQAVPSSLLLQAACYSRAAAEVVVAAPFFVARAPFDEHRGL